jgi:hypothetical protein
MTDTVTVECFLGRRDRSARATPERSIPVCRPPGGYRGGDTHSGRQWSTVFWGAVDSAVGSRLLRFRGSPTGGRQWSTVVFCGRQSVDSHGFGPETSLNVPREGKPYGSRWMRFAVNSRPIASVSAALLTLAALASDSPAKIAGA